MASLSYDMTKKRATVHVALGDRRFPVRLGRCNRRQAETAQRFIEDLAACRRTGAAPKDSTAEWVASAPAVIRKRLERAGLVGPLERRECPTLGEWLAGYVSGRSDVKAATATVYGHTRRNLLAFLGEGKRLDEITPGDADAFRVHLTTDEALADNTTRRRLGIAKQFFRAAVRRKLIGENPFDGQSTAVRQNPRRAHFVSVEETQAVLDACPNAAWRAVFALCRWGGLRCASEVAALRWADVNWERMRFTVHASKTEHHADAGVRIVPIFPELFPYLMEAFEQAEPGTVHCCPQYANANQMYRKAMLEIVRRAGLKRWPKLFQNCRATRETELVERWPVQVVCEWIGNSPQVAAKHYLQVTEDHYAEAARTPAEKAVRFPVRSVLAPGCAGLRDGQGDAEKQAVCGPAQTSATPCNGKGLRPVGRRGLEPDNVTGVENRDLRNRPSASGAQNGALSASSGPFDPDLQRVIDAWATLTADARRAVLGLIDGKDR